MKQLSSGITISPELQAICPDLVLGCLSCQVQISAAPPALCAEVATYCADMAKDIALADVNQQPAIARTRAAYRALGKEPSRYRPSAEALMRRVAQGKGLYQVNNVVDLL
ncbi:MAG TPA: hypothetical protein ENJ82_08280, partial [Bacteroidetes bacterium]|nr:hypothetical protein [Bacteroidota bacterium]